MDTLYSPGQKQEAVEKQEKFFPSGAIAFFIALILLCLAIWFGIYFIMIERA